MLYSNIFFSNQIGVIVGNKDNLTIIYSNQASSEIAKQVNLYLNAKYLPELLTGKKIDVLFKSKIDLIKVQQAIKQGISDSIITKIGKYTIEFNISKLNTLTKNLNKFIITWSIKNDLSNINFSDIYGKQSINERMILTFKRYYID